MANFDPYVQQSVTDTLTVIVAVRPIVLAQGSDAIDGVVNVAGDRDLVVYADQVTIEGVLQFRRAPQAAAPGSGNATTGDPERDGAPGKDGCSVLILAREIDTIPGKDGKGNIAQPTLDVSGEVGGTSDKYWTVAAAAGATGAAAADEGDCFNPETQSGGDETFAEEGESAATLDDDDGDAPDPDCKMNGQKGANGGAGGKGGTISIRCAHFATDAALVLNADGGDGGDGLRVRMGVPAARAARDTPAALPASCTTKCSDTVSVDRPKVWVAAPAAGAASAETAAMRELAARPAPSPSD